MPFFHDNGFKKAKINFYLIRTETVFIVFLRKINFVTKDFIK